MHEILSRTLEIGQDAPEAASEGTRSIERVVRMLRVLSARPSAGWSLSALAEAADLKKTTAHRMLARLEIEGLVHRRASDHHYVFGPFFLEASFAVPGLHSFIVVCDAVMQRLAEQTGATALLSVRSGMDFVVAASVRHQGSSGVLAECGAKRPLFAATPGMAILGGLSETKQQAVIRHCLTGMSYRNASRLRMLHEVWQRSRPLGYAVSYGEMVPGVNTLAVPLRLSRGEAFASITLAGVAGKFDASRAERIAAQMNKECVAIMSAAPSFGFLGLYASCPA
jgi:DNA-binding IclR family transcriptional regulator